MNSAELEVGIPLLTGVELARQVVLDVLEWPNIGKVHLSVNQPGIESEKYHELATIDSRISVTCQPKNLGLYGNFRFLVENSKLDYFAWHAYDDRISPATISNALSKIASTSNSTLAVIPYELQECLLDPLRWEGERLPGVLPITSDRREIFSSALNAEPSWIFGIWKSGYLKSIYPKRDFDWLDSYILYRALIEAKVVVVDDSEPMTIGTWTRLNKIPNSVNGHDFNARVFILKSFLSSLKFGYLFRYQEISDFRKVSRFRLSQAKKLSELLMQQRN